MMRIIMGDGMGLGLADEEVERVGFQMRQGNATKFQLDGEGQKALQKATGQVARKAIHNFFAWWWQIVTGIWAI